MSDKKGYTLHQVDRATIDLLHDAKDRFSREVGVKVSLQTYLNKILVDHAEQEQALQNAAAQEYEKQQREDAES